MAASARALDADKAWNVLGLFSHWVRRDSLDDDQPTAQPKEPAS
jgi:hypothetical protein